MNDAKIIKYFGFGTNKDLDMMEHMIGRSGIKGENGKLFGYEMGILKGSQFRDKIPPNSPAPVSPRTIILNNWGPDFLMYVSRPNPKGVVNGTIWDITSEEFELVREWEMVDYGAQEDAKGLAMNSKGEIIEVITQTFLEKPDYMDKVVVEENYDPYIAPKDMMLKKSDFVRIEYLKNKNSKTSL